MNALWHGLVTVLLVLVLVRWLPPLAARRRVSCSQWHPVHVEAVRQHRGPRRRKLLAACGDSRRRSLAGAGGAGGRRPWCWRRSRCSAKSLRCHRRCRHTDPIGLQPAGPLLRRGQPLRTPAGPVGWSRGRDRRLRRHLGNGGRRGSERTRRRIPMEGTPGPVSPSRAPRGTARRCVLYPRCGRSRCRPTTRPPGDPGVRWKASVRRGARVPGCGRPCPRSSSGVCAPCARDFVCGRTGSALVRAGVEPAVRRRSSSPSAITHLAVRAAGGASSRYSDRQVAAITHAAPLATLGAGSTHAAR